jgi:hypothetical protein
MTVKFRENFTLCISGSSGVGKTRLLLYILENAKQCLTRLPTTIIICFSCEQNFYEKFKQFGIPVILHKGVLENDPPEGSLIIFDDLQTETDKILPFFIKLSHHLHLSVIYITQNIFLKQNRDITLNTNYIILFASWRDKKQISILASQIDPNNSSWIIKSYRDATKQPFTYILFDFTPKTQEEFRIRDHVVPEITHFYVDDSIYPYFDLNTLTYSDSYPYVNYPNEAIV